MSIHLVPAAQAWTQGCPLWVTSQPQKSQWGRKLDWSLNFQITKGLKATFPERSEALSDVLKKVKWKLAEDLKSNPEVTLVAAGQWLPCSWVVVLNSLGSESGLSESLKSLNKVWTDFNRPRMRLFLPAQLGQETLKKAWGSVNLPTDFELVIE